MTMLESNLYALSRVNPMLISQLSSDSSTVIEWYETVDNSPLPYITTPVENIPHRLVSEYSPQNEMRIFFQQFEPYCQNNSFFYIVGLGTGEIIDCCIPYIGTEGKIFIYEPNCEYFLQLLEKKDLCEHLANPQITWIIGNCNDNNTFNYLKAYNNTNPISPDKLIIINLPHYQELYPANVNNYHKALIDFRYFQEQTKLTISFYLSDTISNPLKKLYYFKDAFVVDALQPIWNQNIPVIIISAGPSLKKNGHLLSKAKGHCILVAVDMALSTLHELGVIPDVIINMDATVDGKINFSKFPEFQNLPLLCNTFTGEQLFTWNQGPKLLFREKEFIQSVKKEADIPTLPYSYYGSVSIAAFAIFSMLGTKNVILVGQDLSFGADGASHSGEVLEEFNASENYDLPGYYGGTVHSRSDWYNFWTWFEREIPNTNYETVYNATEGGVCIPHTVQLPLEEAITTLSADGLTWDNSIYAHTEHKITKEQYSQMESTINLAKQEVHSLKSISEENYIKEKEAIRNLRIAPLLSEIMSTLNDNSEFARFQKAVSYMTEHGWK